MKRNERKLISKFASDKLILDKDFKMELRSRILRRSQQSHEQPKTKRWLKLAPALMAVAGVLIAVLVITTGAPNNNYTSPLISQKVSAEELLERSENYYKLVDPSKAEFYKSIRMFKQGPMFEECRVVGMGSGAPRERTISMAFNSSSTNVEASYSRIEDETGALLTEISRYDDTPIEMYVDIPQDVSIPSFFENYKNNDKLAYKVLDGDGQDIAVDGIKETEAKGRRVYQFYLLPDPQLTSNFTECQHEITQVVLDAQTYAIIEFNLYATNTSPENLIVSNTEEVTYSSPGEEAALKMMAELGFSKEKSRNATDIYQ